MKLNIIILLLIISAAVLSCEESFLEEKPDRSMVVPKTIDDLRALLNNSIVMNRSYGGLSNIASDDFYLLDNTWHSLTIVSEKNAYVWADDIYENELFVFDWKMPFQVVFYANIVIDSAKKLKGKNKESKIEDKIIAEAKFYRAWAYHCLSVLYCKTYVPESAKIDKGLPLRTDYDVNVFTKQSSLDDTYNFIVTDLSDGIENLPDVSDFATVPSKASTYGLLARIYLSMGEYDKSLDAAKQSLAYNNELLNYNRLEIDKDYPFQILNKEVLFHASQVGTAALSRQNARIDTVLYNSYSNNDLRKRAFFIEHIDGTMLYKGSYNEDYVPFNGITTAEIYLTEVECLARLARTSEAKDKLKQFLVNRYSSNIPDYDVNDILKYTLEERRKELVFRGIRWMDLKRLNLEESTSTVLKRNIGGKEYILLPNSERYVFPIPNIVLDFQNL